MPPRRRKSTARKAKPTRRSRPRRSGARARKGGFVGRDASPVLDHYPPKSGAPPAPAPLPVQTRPSVPPPLTTSPTTSATPPALAPTGPAPPGLLTLERPFDVDEFSSLLGGTSIRVQVPKDALAEVLRRVTDFMGFGIYVYAVTVRPGPDETLKRFVVELQRVDYSAAAGRWVPFEDRGRSDSPFGPGGRT